MQITLKAARINAGLSQTEVAEKLNRTKETISKWETGKVKLKAIDFQQLCNLYKIEMPNVFLPGQFALSE